MKNILIIAFIAVGLADCCYGHGQQDSRIDLADGRVLIVQQPRVDQQRIREVMQSRYGDEGVAILGAWLNLLADSKDLPKQQQLVAVNDFFNRHVRTADDIDIWGEVDYWATPLETLGVRRGDCEDYAIAKYMSLKMLGVPRERLRLIYVRAQRPGGHSQAHMVLGYYDSPEATPLILDNLVPQMQPAHQRTDLRPVFSFNSDGLWVGDSPQSRADPTARLSRWRDVLTRMKHEGMGDSYSSGSGSGSGGGSHSGRSGKIVELSSIGPEL